MRRLLLASAFFGLATSAMAQSAPFCVVSGTGTNCWYYDAPSCQREAARVRGACAVNNQRQRSSDPWSTPYIGSDRAFDQFERGVSMGQSMGEDIAASRESRRASSRDDALLKFCQDLQAQDLATLEHMPTGTEAESDAWARTFAVYHDRSMQCFELARGAP